MIRLDNPHPSILDKFYKERLLVDKIFNIFVFYKDEGSQTIPEGSKNFYLMFNLKILDKWQEKLLKNLVKNRRVC